MNWIKIFGGILLCMIGYDLSLHLVELFNLISYHPLYPYFTDFQQYTIFWCIYWGTAFVLTGLSIKMMMGVKYAQQMVSG